MPDDVTPREQLELVVRCLDLTALAGTESPEDIGALCDLAVRPVPEDPGAGSVAAVCIYPSRVPAALERLRGTGVAVAAVAGGFPRGDDPLPQRLREIRATVAAGAQEIDTVLNRPLLLHGRTDELRHELSRAREAAGAARLKVILETGELGSLELVRSASLLAMDAGADFVKTSTGKVAVGATPPAARCMMEAARDFAERTGRPVGVKVAGGVRTAAQALAYLALAREILGPGPLGPDRFRIGASSLLADLRSRLGG